MQRRLRLRQLGSLWPPRVHPRRVYRQAVVVAVAAVGVGVAVGLLCCRQWTQRAAQLAGVAAVVMGMGMVACQKSPEQQRLLAGASWRLALQPGTGFCTFAGSYEAQLALCS